MSIFYLLIFVTFHTTLTEGRTVLDEQTHRSDVKHFESQLDTAKGYWSPSTSSIDWCERNYVITPYIAEFWNCISSLVFCFLSGILFIHALYHRIERRFLILDLSFVLVGLGSACFHGTLTHLGQMFDELPMVYSLIIWLCVLFRMDQVKNLQHNTHTFDCLIIFAILYGILWTYMQILQTFVIVFQVHFALMVVGAIFKSIMLYRQTQHHTRNIKIFIISYVSWLALALLCWILDQKLCEKMNSPGGFNPQLHAWWHILCGIDSYVGTVCSESLRLLSIKYQLHQKDYSDSHTKPFKPEDHLHIVWYFGLPLVDYSNRSQMKKLK